MSDKEDHDGGLSGQGDVLLQTRPKTKKPSLYKVLLLNDDFTPMEFVIQILQKVFGKSVDEAQNIMWMVHTQGLGVCGVYTYEIAETKATQVVDLARKNQHPLQCTLEKE